MSAISARLQSPMDPEGRVVPTWVAAEVLVRKGGEVEVVVVLIVVASEAEVVIEEDSGVAEVETVEVMDQAKWIPGVTTDRTDVSGHTSWTHSFFLRLYSFILYL